MVEMVMADSLRHWRVTVEYYPNATWSDVKWYWEVREVGELLDAGHTEDVRDAMEAVSDCIERHL